MNNTRCVDIHYVYYKHVYMDCRNANMDNISANVPHSVNYGHKTCRYGPQAGIYRPCKYILTIVS